MSIEVNQVSKRFGVVQALRNLTVTFEEGKIYALLGRNGAGKSTLLNLIANRFPANSGTITVDGMRAWENDAAQSRLYLMNDQNLFPKSMSVKNAIQWTGALYPNFDMDYAYSVAERFGLRRDAKIGRLSTGYVTIFKLVLALAVNTPYLFLDEPVLGLDANHRELFYKLLVEKYAEHPCTIVIATHLIEEAASFVEDVVVIQQGCLLRAGSKENLLRRIYSVSGKDELVRSYLLGKRILGMENLGTWTTAYVEGEPDRTAEGLEFGGVDLQKLFILLTNG